ncbi:MAG: chloride channel protein [Rikenellaceae bacterium]
MNSIKKGLLEAREWLLNVSKKLPEKNLIMIIAVIVGIVTAFAAAIFESSVTSLRLFVTNITKESNINIAYLFTPLIGIILVSLFVKHIIKDNISHGVTKVLYAISHKGAKIKSHNSYSSIIAGVTTIGFGGSVGPEAPMVMTGSAIGSNIGKFFNMDYRNTAILLGCGAAGALAAIFKAPITGVIFVLEVLMLDISMLSIIPLLIAAVTATTITYFFHGFDTVFHVPHELIQVSLIDMPFYGVFGLLCGLVAFALIFFGSRIEALFKKIGTPYKKWIIGGLSIGLIIMCFPPLYGQGYDSIINLINSNTDELFVNSFLYDFKDNTWIILAFLMGIILLKPIAMACTNGAGGVGGAFAPSLFLGAFTGYFFAMLLNTIFDTQLSQPAFALVGMAGVMSGAMNSPLTAIFLIAEITGGYGLFVPLMMVSAISFAISYYFSPYSVYTRELILSGESLSITKERSMLFIDFSKLVENEFTCISENMTLGALVVEVSKSSRNIFPVLNTDGVFIGVVTLDDIRTQMFNREKYYTTYVSSYMKSAPALIYENEPVAAVLKKFDNTGAWNLPVVSEDRRYIGFISKSKIFSEYRNELQKN